MHLPRGSVLRAGQDFLGVGAALPCAPRGHKRNGKLVLHRNTGRRVKRPTVRDTSAACAAGTHPRRAPRTSKAPRIGAGQASALCPCRGTAFHGSHPSNTPPASAGGPRRPGACLGFDARVSGRCPDSGGACRPRAAPAPKFSINPGVYRRRLLVVDLCFAPAPLTDRYGQKFAPAPKYQ